MRSECMCQIQWLREGNSTPDNNPAVMMAHFHEPVHETFTGKTLKYSGNIQASFPICAEHYAQVTPRMRFENGGAWTFSPISQG